jgi:hypothetical protein
MRLSYILSILVSTTVILGLPTVEKRNLLDAFKPITDPIKQSFEDFGKQVSDTATCVGKAEFTYCMDAFHKCADNGVGPRGCDQGKVCLDKAGVDLKKCFD